MYRTRDHFFARTALAGDQDAGVSLRDALHESEQLSHRGAGDDRTHPEEAHGVGRIIHCCRLLFSAAWGLNAIVQGQQNGRGIDLDSY